MLFLQLAVDGYVGILIETAVRFETGFGFGTAFDNREIMIEKTNFPFKGFGSIGMFQGMSLALGEFDEFAVRHTGSRPSLGEMVRIEFVEPFTEPRGTDDDVFAALVAEFEIIHGTPDGINAGYRPKISHTF